MANVAEAHVLSLISYEATAAEGNTLPERPIHGQRFYRPELDVLRFVAFLCVFTIHALGMYPGVIRGERIIAPIGAYGMCLFFFLSAYLITELLRREKAETGTTHVRAFYVRRILRIWPLYFGFLLFGKIVGQIYGPFHLENGRLMAFIFLLGNWYLARFGINESPVGPLWSISLEEQFYLVWPILARLGGMRTLLLCSMALLPVAWLTLYHHTGYQPSIMGLEFDGTIWCNTFVQFQFFALGSIVAILLRGNSFYLSNPTRLAVFCLGFGLWLSASCLFRLGRFGQHLPGSVLVAGYDLIGIGCLLLFVSLHGIAADLLPKSLIYLGKISYGLYVFHLFFLEVVYLLLRHFMPHFSFGHSGLFLFIVNFVCAILLTIAVAVLSYRYFETPFLVLRKRFVFIQSRAI